MLLLSSKENDEDRDQEKEETESDCFDFPILLGQMVHSELHERPRNIRGPGLTTVYGGVKLRA
jgi:hypothetical protein